MDDSNDARRAKQTWQLAASLTTPNLRRRHRKTLKDSQPLAHH